MRSMICKNCACDLFLKNANDLWYQIDNAMEKKKCLHCVVLCVWVIGVKCRCGGVLSAQVYKMQDKETGHGFHDTHFSSSAGLCYSYLYLSVSRNMFTVIL